MDHGRPLDGLARAKKPVAVHDVALLSVWILHPKRLNAAVHLDLVVVRPGDPLPRQNKKFDRAKFGAAKFGPLGLERLFKGSGARGSAQPPTSRPTDRPTDPRDDALPPQHWPRPDADRSPRPPGPGLARRTPGRPRRSHNMPRDFSRPPGPETGSAAAGSGADGVRAALSLNLPNLLQCVLYKPLLKSQSRSPNPAHPQPWTAAHAARARFLWK